LAFWPLTTAKDFRVGGGGSRVGVGCPLLLRFHHPLPLLGWNLTMIIFLPGVLGVWRRSWALNDNFDAADDRSALPVIWC
jgi:hypothetical protein